MKKSLFAAFGAVLMIAGVVGCKHKDPNFIYMWEMVYAPSLKAQEEGSMRLPPAGTIPRDFKPYAYTDGEVAGRELQNPFKATHKVLARGQTLYNTYCIVCHGAYGEGDGPVAPKFGRPPSLQDRPVSWADGRIYHTITKGQNLMPPYNTQISQDDRWKIIHYIRALQRAKHPTSEDLKLYDAQASR